MSCEREKRNPGIYSWQLPKYVKETETPRKEEKKRFIKGGWGKIPRGQEESTNNRRTRII